MKPVPLSLIIDDSCPLVHVYRWHHENVHGGKPVTRDGRPLLDGIPNSFLDAFCDVTQSHGMKGKFSIVPSPASRGDIVKGVEGNLPATVEWLDTAKRRLAPGFDFSPEIITHDRTVDLPTGLLLPLGESDWSQKQDRRTLTPYLARSLALLRDAGVDATGITSPWVFGRDVEAEYIAAIVAAQRQVFGRSCSWYFLHTLAEQPSARPWVAFRDGESALVSIPTNTEDAWWRAIDDPRTDRAFVESMADELLSADGRRGAIRTVLDSGGWPAVLTHWQSLFSNGQRSGLASLDLLGKRVRDVLAGEVEWTTCSGLMEMTLVRTGA